MKKLISFLLTLIIGGIIFPVVWMMIPQTREVILFMAADEIIFEQAQKRGKTFDSEDEKREIAFLEEIRVRQGEEINSLKKDLDKSFCQKSKEVCDKKIDELDNGEIKLERAGEWKGNRGEMIQKLEGYIGDWEESKKSASDSSRKADFQQSIDKAKQDIQKIKDMVVKNEAEKKTLLLGECHNYERPCKDESISQ